MSKTREDYIEEFHKAFGVAINTEPTVELLKLRKTLISEETKEVIEELDKAIELLESGKEVPKELYTDLLKELSDLQVVLSGTAVSLKPVRKLDEAFIRVHESNMSKLGKDGKPILREDGKVLKGPKYFKPDLSDLT
jgi:predicted HAD superfamily Cof-like phosphohydrolase